MEKIVLLDESGGVVGSAEKLSSHHDNTPLHLAFSCYIFNSKGKVLVTRRASIKKVWPSVLTNSVCGHPMPDEEIEAAVNRRSKYELGISNLNIIKVILPDYRYKTPQYNGIIENEVCPVYLATTDDSPRLNPLEVDEFYWQSWSDFLYGVHSNPEEYSWWCKDQIKQLNKIGFEPKISGKI